MKKALDRFLFFRLQSLVGDRASVAVLFAFVIAVFQLVVTLPLWLSGDAFQAILRGLEAGLIAGIVLLYRITGLKVVLIRGLWWVFLLYIPVVVVSGPAFWTVPSGVLIFPLVIFYIGGLAAGTRFAGYSLFLQAVILLPPWVELPVNDVPLTARILHLSVYAAFCILSWLFEYSRSLAQKKERLVRKRLVVTARTDELTGLPNRRYLLERMEQEWQLCARRDQVYSVLLMDIDHFKRINDRYGHSAGDKVLQQIAELFHNCLRKSDTPCRWGGEEFLVLLPDTPTGMAGEVAERIRSTLAETPLQGEGQGQTIKVTMSIGGATLKKGYSMKALIQHADARLYRAKRAGRNRVVMDDDC